jgi:hypothetical protein
MTDDRVTVETWYTEEALRRAGLGEADLAEGLRQGIARVECGPRRWYCGAWLDGRLAAKGLTGAGAGR